MVRSTKLLVKSFGPGVYIGFSMLVLLKVPSPAVVQSIVSALFSEVFCI